MLIKSRFDKIIEDLDLKPLSQSLRPILRFAQEIEDIELETWVRLELDGYYRDNSAMSDATEVPGYRGVGGEWKDEIGNVLIITDQDLSYINEFRLRNSVVELESFQNSTHELGFRHPGLSSALRENLHIEVSTFWFRASSVRRVLSAIRTQASDRLMSRQSSLNELKSVTQNVDQDVIELRPNFYGIGVNLRALWKLMRGRG